MTDLFRLDGKVAIVTGSTRGIGRGIAVALRDAGAEVVISSENAEDTAAASAELGLMGVPCDVTDAAQLEALVARTVERFGGLDILVCNAGITDSRERNTVEEFDRVIAVNLRSQVALTNLALPHLETRKGSVILIASIGGLRGNGSINSYALAKAGVAQLARNIAVQWGPKGVRANAISPGLTRTELIAQLPAGAEFMQRRMQMTPLRRMGEVAEIGGAAVFLASAAGGFVNGHNLVIDGGTVITDGS
jgi:NAD(P)-dependent dehydrogenase (short-subunit alcohol dehydrogenase family)